LLLKDMALKTFRSQTLSAESFQRFQREAQAIGKLHHKNIVDVFDFGLADGRMPYYTMELLSGYSLADELKQSGRLATGDTIKTFSQVAEALAHAHRQNIVHRDIKPANIILVADSPTASRHTQVKLVDFGIAKLAENTTISDDQSLTRAGTIFGSPLYMSPEQSLGLPTDQRTDIYSFGCAMYETLTGKPPFVGNTAFITMLHHQRQTPPTLNGSGVDSVFPQRLEAVIAKLLAKRPEDRYHTFDQVLEELDRCYGEAPPERPVSPGIETPATNSVAYGRSEGSAEMSSKGAAISKHWATALAAAGIVTLGGLALTFGGAFKQASNRTAMAVKTPAATAVSKDARVPVAEERVVRYFQGKSPDGKRKIFSFSKNVELGSFLIDDVKIVFCRGTIEVANESQIVFNPDEGPLERPELFAGFGPGDIYGVKLANASLPWTDRHIQAISQIPGLQMLDVSEIGCVSTQTLAIINGIHSLKALLISDTKITGRDLLAIKRLQELESLNVSRLKDLSPLWQHLANNPVHIINLVANGCQYNSADMANIGHIKTLLSFSATNSKIDNVALASLAPATHLQALRLEHNGICHGAEQYFARYKELQKVRLNRKDHFDGSRWAQLHDLLPPGCLLKSGDPEDLREDVTPVKWSY